MSDTILAGNFTIYYLDDNRQKRIEWTGGVGTNTMNELYSALQDLFDESLQMDDGVPMSAQTPTEYTIGIIDTGDNDPWYISYETLEHLTGGALRTASWTRSVGTNTGIIIVPVVGASNNITTSDIGYDISTDTDNDAGTLLDVIDVGDTNDYLVIRPDSSAAGNSFDNAPTAGDGITCNSQTAVQAAVATTGEQIWANLYSIGTIENDTHIYLYQGTVADTARERNYSIVDQTQDWWGDGHIDICVPIRDYKTAANPIIDNGYVSVFARKLTTLYDNFEVSCSITSGGRNPIPLATGPDLDNTTGYRSVTFSGDNYAAGWSVGDEMTGDTSGARGIITQIDTPGSTQTVHYYLIDDPLTDFQADENVSNDDDSGTGDTDGSGPTNQGPALASWFTNNTPPTVSYTTTTVDIDDDGTQEGYGITLDCNQNPLTEVYEWIKYIFRRGETTTGSSDGIEAEQYIGGEVYLDYSGSVSGGTIDEGDDVLQATTGATGIVISHDLTNKEILLRNTRGSFNTSNTVTSQDNSGTITPDNAATPFAPKKAAPLGTFAGGTFFGARGVVLQDWVVASDENSFQLTDTAGNIRTRPVAITIEVSNLTGTDETTITDDRVAIFRLTGSGGDVDKTEYSAAGGESIGDATLVVDTAIATDVPGKTTGGVLRIRDASDNNQEYRIRYASWSTSTFNLANIVITSADAGTDTNTIVEAGAFTNAKRGDIVINNGNGHDGISYVTSVDDANTIKISPAITGQTVGDQIELNACPIAVDTADDVYVALLDKYAAAGTEAVSIVYDSQIFFRVKVRNVENSTKIVPFSTDDTTTGTNRSIPTIRTTDVIYQ
jgi:hypothetical protein